MIIVPGCGPVWPIRKPLKAFGFTVVVTRTEINQRSIGNSIILNHQRFMPNNNYSFDTFAKIFEVAYFYITRSLIQDGEDVDVLRSPDSKFDWEKCKTGTENGSGMIFEMICESVVLIFCQSRVFLLRNESVLSTWRWSLALDWLRLQTSSDHDLFSPCFIIAIILIYSHQNKP